MYYVHTKDLVVDDPYPMYQNISELIEADGEAEELFLQECQYNGYAERCFTAIDYVSDEDIQLDITDYIGEKSFKVFEKCLENTDEEEELSMAKLNSWYIAATMRRRR